MSTRKQIFEEQNGCYEHGWLPGLGSSSLQKLTEGCPACLIISLRSELEAARENKCDPECGEFEAAMLDWKYKAEQAETKLANAESELMAVENYQEELRASRKRIKELQALKGEKG